MDIKFIWLKMITDKFENAEISGWEMIDKAVGIKFSACSGEIIFL